MQYAEVRGVHGRLDELEPVAVDPLNRRHDLRLCGQLDEFELVKRGRRSFAEEHPEDATRFAHRIVIHADAAAEALLVHGLRRNLEALAFSAVLPAVEDASQRIIFVTAQSQRDASMRATFIKESYLSIVNAERDVVVAQQTNPKWRAAG